MGRKPKVVYQSEYLRLSRDGTLEICGLDDNEELSPEETKKLFDALFEIYVES